MKKQANFSSVYRSPIGPLRVVGEGKKITGLRPGSGAAGKTGRLPKPARRWLDGYFSGETGIREPASSLDGTLFQRTVWKALRSIPFGRCVSYAELARRVRRPRAVRAVARAVGRNPVAILVPCHRVIGSDGSLTGYAYGLRKKAWLLRHEGGRDGKKIR